jgi:hypothetical protein
MLWLLSSRPLYLSDNRDTLVKLSSHFEYPVRTIRTRRELTHALPAAEYQLPYLEDEDGRWVYIFLFLS